MRRLDIRPLYAHLTDIYNTKDENAKGRLISLGSALITSLYNVFITGVFYTGFLSMYNMSITDVGIISFIPLIANCFSVFSSVILERIPKRKGVLLAAKIFYYTLYILVTTLIPQFVSDYHAKVTWFAVILFVANAVYALFSPGFTPWFYFFYPEDTERRSRYIAFNQMFSSIMSSLTLIFSALLSDALASTPYQNVLILGLRYFAFLLVLADVWIQSRAIEYPYPKCEHIKLSQVFILPFKYKKFMHCLLLMFAWNYVGNLNSGLWLYHLLNHMELSYTTINITSVAYTLILIFTSRYWRGLLRRYSWIKTFGIAAFLFVPTEILFFHMNKSSLWIFFPNSMIQNFLSVGLNLAYGNILYMNLPEENSTAHIAFYTIGCNLFAFLGSMTGTRVSSITGDTMVMLGGMPVYSVQYTTLMRAVFLFVLGLFLIIKWRIFTPEKDIREIEENRELLKKLKTQQRG